MDTILICDDDRDIVNALKIYLTGPDRRLLEAYDGAAAVRIAAEEELRLILMDIMMPGMDGIEAMARIRETSNVPIILLTAKSEDADKILGLNVGADDYITKPFHPMEVAARVNSQLRRYTRLGAVPSGAEVYTVGGVELNDRDKTVTVDGAPVSLTPKEFDILRLLMAEPGRVYSPKEIYREVWRETPFRINDNTVAVHIRHIREKIELDPNEPRYLTVVFGKGYKMEWGRRE